jgi:fructose-1,6-bisphosphatase II / sedoheptulose-1,7-bisphosphatase
MGGQMWGKLLFRNDDERPRRQGRNQGPRPHLFARRDGDGRRDLRGHRRHQRLDRAGRQARTGFLTTETILMRSKTGSVRRMIYRNPVK